VKQQTRKLESFRELGMTEFAQDLRHHCRNPRCRMKLKEPVGNPRDAFCARGCYESFHLKRCRVCEKSLEAKYRKVKPKIAGGHTRYVKVEKSSPTCGATDCKRRWRQKDNTGRFSAPKQATGYQGSQKSNLRKETPAAQALFGAIQGPIWRQTVGSPLTPNQFHCATIPDGPDSEWQGGEFQRIEAKNRAALREHFRELAKQCLIQPHHPPVNVLGGYRFPDAPTIDLSPLPANDTPRRLDWRACSPSVPVADDVSTPDFLKREPAAVSESTDGILEAAE
jgi:hypothetical protein